ncbi:hypothetical protein FY034_18185 (plasmid) [Trichlorobacter lovleyi]|uniref:hypothetical protein n=1 Tax=Trichlorobacter lovleyi TaxID=313985 RepID=UPI00223F897D|nr:hypothetical protein [Trichlorobacter lovleyi]QOX80931.1 hypothetical protein FY034_18185 [Trichlorobacter lovleyi]
MGPLEGNKGMALPAVVFWLCIVGGLVLLVMDVVKSKDSYEGKKTHGDKYVNSTSTSSKGTLVQEIGANLGLVKDAKWWSSPAKLKREEVTQVFASYSSPRTKHKQNSGAASYYVDQAK